MDFQQQKLSGFTREEYDGNGTLVSRTVTDFSTEPWTRSEYDGDGNLIDRYHISRPTKDQPSQRIPMRLNGTVAERAAKLGLNTNMQLGIERIWEND